MTFLIELTIDHELQASREPSVRQTKLEALKALISETLNSHEISDAFKLYARAVGLEADGQEFTLRFSLEASEEAIKRTWADQIICQS